MSDVPIRPQAIEAVARAIFADDHPDEQWEDFEDDAPELEACRRTADVAIRAFLAAEEIGTETQTYYLAHDVPPKVSRRLCGPWRRADV